MDNYIQQAEDFLKATDTKISIVYDRFDTMDWDTPDTKRAIYKVTLENSSSSFTFDFGSSLASGNKEGYAIDIDGDQIEIYTGVQYTKSGNTYSFYVKASPAELRMIDSKTLTVDSLYKRENLEKTLLDRANYYADKETKNLRRKVKVSDIPQPSVGEFQQSITRSVLKKIEELKNEKVIISELKDNPIPPNAYDVLVCLTKYDPGTFENFCADYGYDEDSRKAYSTYEGVVEEWNEVSALFTPEQLEILSEIQ